MAAGGGTIESDYVHQGSHSWGMLQQYCAKCHNTTDWAGGVAFDTLNPATVPANAEVWESAVLKLSGRLMPPPGNPQPTQKQVDKFVDWLQNYLDAAGAVGEEPRAGHVSIQRLNRTQYGAVVQDLLGVDVNVDDLLPPETQMGGFDNIAAALAESPLFLDQYVRAARIVAKLAVGNPDPHLSQAFFPAQELVQSDEAELPLGSQGGMEFTYDFPADGRYEFTIKNIGVGFDTTAPQSGRTVILLVGGKEVFRGKLGDLKDLQVYDRDGAAGSARTRARFADISAHIAAGQHKVVVTFGKVSDSVDDYVVADSGGAVGRSGSPRFSGVQVSGPFGPTHLSETASRKKIFICQPQAPEQERTCAMKITEHLARLAFRRPVTPADFDSLMPFYDEGYKLGGFNQGIEHVVAAILVRPPFLFRAIRPTRDADNGTMHRLSDFELASRLSFFLWDRGPDDELLRLAASGQLAQPQVLDAQARRMLADPRAASLVDDFAFHWLDFDKLNAVVPDRALFPDYTPQLGQDFVTEAKLFLSSILLENQSVLGLLNANYTFLDQQLARHYGIDSVHGSQFRRVVLDDPVRWGLLGKGAMLMETSYANRTSPVRRGAWILDKLMGTPPAQPPAGVNMNLDVKLGQKPTTVRARLEAHRASPSCNQCHGVIDPYGLSLENFDATGEWRAYDGTAHEAIDAASVLPGGVARMNGVNDLRRQLMSRPDRFATAMTGKLLMYALGRKTEYFDMPQVRGIVRAAKKDDYRFFSIVLGIINSDSFRMQSEPKSPLPAAKVALNAGPKGAR